MARYKTFYARGKSPRDYPGYLYAILVVGSTSDSIYRTLTIKSRSEKDAIKGDDGKPVELSPRLAALAKETLNALPMLPQERKRFQFFLRNGLDFRGYNAPWLSAKTGPVPIGIPYYYEVFENKDMNENFLKLLGKSMRAKDEWQETPKSKEFLASLMLSDDAKKYGIAHAIHLQCSQWPLIETMATPFLFTAAYAFHYRYQGNIRSILGTKGQMAISLLFIAATAVAINFILVETLNMSHNESDREIFSNVYSSFKKAGIEFYEKLIQRNKALRVLEENGERKYDPKGDSKAWIYGDYEPLGARLVAVKKRMEKIKNRKPDEIKESL